MFNNAVNDTTTTPHVLFWLPGMVRGDPWEEQIHILVVAPIPEKCIGLERKQAYHTHEM